MNPRPYRNPGFLISSAVVALLLVLQLSEFTPGKAGADSMDTALKEMQTFVEAYRLVQADYADTGKIDPNALIQGAIRGMLETLGDPHSRYLPVQDAKDLMIETAGEFGGIGIHIGMENERLSVIAPGEGTPAWRGGVEAGDAIMTIDGRATDTMSLDVAVTLLRGPVGTGVTIEVKRAGLEELIKIPLVRDVIQIHSVRFTQYEDLGYIRISQFSERTADELDEAISALTKQNVRGLILDLRDNPGGVLTGATAVSNRFIDSGVIVSVVSRDPRQTTSYSASPMAAATKLPVAVLVNGGSASASEIVSGAIQDHHRGVVIGTKTYGKGSVQTVENLPDNSKIALTTARYFTPSGRSIHGVGLHPDTGMEIEIPILSDTELKALKRLNDTDIVRDYARKKADYTQADIDRLAILVKAADIDIPRDLLERRYVAELARRNDNRMYLLPHLDRQLKKAIDVLHGASSLDEKEAARPAVTARH